MTDLVDSFEISAKFDPAKGFSVACTIFDTAARNWFSNAITDNEAITQMADKYGIMLGG